MPINNLAEDNQNKQEEPDQKDQKSTEKGIPEHKLTPNEVRRLRSNEVKMPDLLKEHEQHKTSAQAELKDLLQNKGSVTPVISVKEYRDFQREIDETDSPELMKQLLDRIRDTRRLKKEAGEKEKDEAQERDPEDPELKKLQKQWDKICDDNVKYIGEKQISGNKAWFERERKKTPTIAHLKDLIAKMEGKEFEHKDGLAPRRAEYTRLAAIYKKYGLGTPEDSSAWIRQEGLSERQDFRKKIEAMEYFFDKVKDTGFYSRETIQARMKENLQAENPQILEARLTESKEIARQESEAFTHMDEHVNIGGKNIRKMSEASRKKYLDHYKTLTFAERKKEVANWELLVDNEAALAKFSPACSKLYADNNVRALDQIYKDDAEGLKMALESFGELDFMQKVEALKLHEKLAGSGQNKEGRDKILILHAAHAKIDTAAGKDIISEKTRARYHEFFENPDNFKNPQSKKPGDTKEMQKAYEILVSASPQEKFKNLAAYESRRQKFQKDLAKLQEINPAITEEEIKKWQSKYDQEGWTRREYIQKQELTPEINKQMAEKKKRRELEEKAGMTDENMEKKSEKSPKMAETISAVTELLSNDQGAEAMKILLEFNDAQPDNPKILFWMQTVANYMKEFGSGKKREKTVEKELEKELEKTAESDENIRRSMLEQQVKTLGLEGAKQSEQRHNQTISAQERARKESMSHLEGSSLEADLTADAYKQLGKDFAIDKEGKAEKMEEITFKDNGNRMQEQDLFRQKRKTQKEQSKLDTRQGLVRSVKDKSGQIISTRVAENLQKEELRKLEEKMADKAEEKVASRVADKPAGNLFDLNSRIMARRKAQELIDEKRHEKLKAA